VNFIWPVFAPICCFLAAIILHIVLWRCSRPRKTMRGLIAIFAAFGGIAVLAQMICADENRAFDAAYLICLYAALVLAYLISYTGLEGQSPSSLIAIAASAAGENGITRADILTLVTEDVFVLPRVTDMVGAGHMRADEYGRYHLTDRGRRFVRLFMLPRSLMRIETRGG
jgi:hypothetical protein